ANVAAARRSGCLIQGGMNTFGDEPELGVALHFDWSSCVVRQHKHRRVIRRLIAPPAFPAFVRPRAADRPEHVAPENPGTDSGKALLRHPVVDTRFAVAGAVHFTPNTRLEKPLHQFGALDAERILKILVRPRSVPVE